MFLLKKLLRKNDGFTLLEVLIALAIMVIALASILTVESNSINASARARQMNVVAMLARNKMSEMELKFEGKTFDEFTKDGGGQFEDPYQDYRWTYQVKEIKFPNIIGGPPSGGSSGGSGGGGQNQSNEIVERISRLITNFLSKALREVNVTIYWKRGTTEQSFTVATYWVDLNHEFQLTE